MGRRQISRRNLLKAAGMGVALLGLGRSRDTAAAQPTKRRPNVVFILVDDLGWADVGCYGSRFHETPNIDKLASEGGIREPLIVRWPGVVRPKSISHEPVTSVDYFPTIAEATGVPLPAGRDIDGVSLIEHLRSGGAKPLNRDAILWHFPHYRGSDVVPYSIIRAGDWKLIKRYEGKPFELFNLKDDLSEHKDLSETLPERVQELDAKLQRWLSATQAKLPVPRTAEANPL